MDFWVTAGTTSKHLMIHMLMGLQLHLVTQVTIFGHLLQQKGKLPVLALEMVQEMLYHLLSIMTTLVKLV